MTNIINRTEITKATLDHTGIVIAYKLDGVRPSKTLHLTPVQAGKMMESNGFILLSSVCDGTLLLRYSKEDGTTVVSEWNEFVQDFKLSQYRALRIVESYYAALDNKKLASNLRAVSPMIVTMNEMFSHFKPYP